MIVQLNPVIWLETPKGLGYAVFLIDEGIDHNLVWVVVQESDGTIWCYDNSDIRVPKNTTHGINMQSLKPSAS